MEQFTRLFAFESPAKAIPYFSAYAIMPMLPMQTLLPFRPIFGCITGNVKLF
jgi:hypothetical protein